MWNLNYLNPLIKFTHHNPNNSNSIFIVNPNLKFLFKEAGISAKIVAKIGLRMCCGNTAAHSFNSLLPNWRQASHYNFSSEPHTPHFLVRATYPSFSRTIHLDIVLPIDRDAYL